MGAERSGPHGLGSLQTQVMEYIWQVGEATVSQVAEHLGRTKPVMYTTILAAMQRLERKGWLVHRAAGRAYVYRAVRSREAAAGGLLLTLLERVFQGDPRQLVNQLLDQHPMSDAELAELRRLIDDYRRQKKHARERESRAEAGDG
jgi:predicted transcriptional regulator